MSYREGFGFETDLKSDSSGMGYSENRTGHWGVHDEGPHAWRSCQCT